MNELEAKISEMKERLKRAQRDRLGKIVVGRLYDDLVDDIEDLFAQNQVRRAELSEKLGLTLNELNTLEEEIYQFRKKTQPSDQEPARAPAEIVESIQFQAVAIRKDEERAQPSFHLNLNRFKHFDGLFFRFCNGDIRNLTELLHLDSFLKVEKVHLNMR